MRLPLQISFRNMHHSEVVERAIVERAEKLERFSDQIMGCRVVVETRHHRHQGNLYHVRFHEEAGKEGPQASTVHVERKVRAAG